MSGWQAWLYSQAIISKSFRWCQVALEFVSPDDVYLLARLGQQGNVNIPQLPNTNVFHHSAVCRLLSPGEQRKYRALIVLADRRLFEFRSDKSIAMGTGNVQPPTAYLSAWAGGFVSAVGKHTAQLEMPGCQGCGREDGAQLPSRQ